MDNPPPPTDPGWDFRDDDSITRFLDEARGSGVIDDETYTRLLWFAEAEPAPPPEVAEPEAPMTPEETTFPDEPVPVLVEAATASAAARAGRHLSHSVPAPETHPPAPTTAKWDEVREAIVSDLTLHWAAYVGVLLTFVGVLGFLLRAFVAVPDAQQPLYELFIALVFFAWAWYLRRQGALLVSKGMELVGGMVLPLVLFAGLVDNAPFPPDFQGRGLIAALTVAALGLSGVYWLVGARNPDSMLRFLVAPLWWLAAMTLGFVFKTDEVLRSDAITRLVSAQPALAAAAIAVTLESDWWLRARSQLRPDSPTVISALVGVPFAYLLTLALAAGEDWAHPFPLVLLGVSTILATENLLDHFEKWQWFLPSRIVIFGVTFATLVPSLGVGLTGLLATVAYIYLFDTSTWLAEPPLVVALSGAGVVTGASMALAEPWTTLVAYTLITVWAHVGWSAWLDHHGAEGVTFTAIAALAPIGVGHALIQMYPAGEAWLLMATILALVATATRYLIVPTPFWKYWLWGTGALVAMGALTDWFQRGGQDFLAVRSMAVLAIMIALAPWGLVSRIWHGAVVLSLGLAMTLEGLGVAGGQRVTIWASLGLALVLAAAVWRRHPSAHLALIGHLTGFGALLAASAPAPDAVAAGFFALGWVLSVAVAETGADSVTGLIARIFEEADQRAEGWESWEEWVAPLFMVGTVALALLEVAGLWPTASRWWPAVLLTSLALVYAVAARLLRRRLPLSRVLALGAAAFSVIGLLLGLSDRIPTIYGAIGVIATALLLIGLVRWPVFHWIAWATTFVLVILLAEQAGVDVDSLHLVSLGWGALLLIGSLVVDDQMAGRREPGQALRSAPALYPAVLGAVTVPLSLAPVYAQPAEIHGWWSLGAALFFLVVALLIRIGAVTALSHGLLAAGIIALSPWPLLDEPWRLVIIAAPLVAVSWFVERRQTALVAGDPWLRWDHAPLAVAHLIGAISLVIGLINGEIAGAALAFGALSVAIGVWKRERLWLDAGNLLILVAALDSGTGWLTIALVGTAVRGAVSAHLSEGEERRSYQVIGVAAAGLAWITMLAWAEVPLVRAVDMTSLFWGIWALLIATGGRFGRIEPDSVRWWGGLGVLGVVAASGVFWSDPVGPWVALGVVGIATAFEAGWKAVDRQLRYMAVAVTGLAWLHLAAGLGWAPTQVAVFTAATFGGLTLLVAELARWRNPQPGSDSLKLARTWLALGALGVLTAVVASLELGSNSAGYWVAGGLTIVAVAFARAATPLSVEWLRDLAGLALLGSVGLVSRAAAADRTWLAGAMVAMATASTVSYLATWNRRAHSIWLGPLLVFGVVANLWALGLTVTAWPARSLLVAVLLSMGVQSVAAGVVRDRPGVVALGPPLVGVAFLVAIGDSISGSAQWYTTPLGLVILAELEILRSVRRSRGQRLDGPDVLTLEWVGIGLVVVPALVEMFSSGIAFGLAAIAASLACLIWAVLTRVRRRAIASAAIALAGMVLMIFAAAAAGAPASASMWIIAVGAGSAVMAVAGLIEAYLSQKGHLMVRLGRLMEGWE